MVMLQRWHEISFFHWSCDPAILKPRLPDGIALDTFDGRAWISLTPFLLCGLRPPLVPRLLGLDFPETNLRTYVVGAEGPGIWFFSLDAARRIAVAAARASYGLPYFWARMRVVIGQTQNEYFSSRRGRANATIKIEKGDPILQQSSLDVFLTARFRLYSIWAGLLITAEVQHAPWDLAQVRILQFEENVRRAMGVEFPSKDFVAHFSTGVDARIGRPTCSIM